MAILFLCPHCGHKLRAAAHGSGQQSPCKCGHLVTIPKSPPLIPAAPPDAAEPFDLRLSWKAAPRWAWWIGGLALVVALAGVGYEFFWNRSRAGHDQAAVEQPTLPAPSQPVDGGLLLAAGEAPRDATAPAS